MLLFVIVIFENRFKQRMLAIESCSLHKPHVVIILQRRPDCFPISVAIKPKTWQYFVL